MSQSEVYPKYDMANKALGDPKQDTLHKHDVKKLE